MNVQNLKDTFYTALATRLAADNPGRTIVLRGVTRPALLVLENELPNAAANGIPDAFCLAWTSLAQDPLGLLQLTCEIRYATAGSAGAGGMDRGRALAAMDAELIAAITMSPQSAALAASAEIAGGGATTQTAPGTSIFWTGPVFSSTLTKIERLERTATVEVFAYA